MDKSKLTFTPWGASAPVAAKDAAAELYRIHKKFKGLTAEVVVDESRPEDAPLHPTFEWDDNVAGEKYRLMQASTIIRAIRIDDSPQFTYVPQTITIRGEEVKGSYQPVARVVKDERSLEAALQHLIRQLGEAQAAVDELKQAAGAERLGGLVGVVEALAIAHELARKLKVA